MWESFEQILLSRHFKVAKVETRRYGTSCQHVSTVAYLGPEPVMRRDDHLQMIALVGIRPKFVSSQSVIRQYIDRQPPARVKVPELVGLYPVKHRSVGSGKHEIDGRGMIPFSVESRCAYRSLRPVSFAVMSAFRVRHKPEPVDPVRCCLHIDKVRRYTSRGKTRKRIVRNRMRPVVVKKTHAFFSFTARRCASKLVASPTANMSASHTTALKKVLRPVHLWAIAVGLVISGEYFGWNYGWGVSGTLGFLLSTAIVTVMYVTFIFSFTELTTSIPQAGGPFSYAQRAFGQWGGVVAGYATVVEFLVTPPAIAFALGSYTHFLYPGVSVLSVALACYLIFVGINLLGIRESAMFSLIVTLLAVAELLVYMGIIAPSFRLDTFLTDPMPFGWYGVFAALPFAIWFYLAIEGVAMVAEETVDTNKTIYKGYAYGIATLVALALGVMILTGGVTPWRSIAAIDYPLPAVLGIVLGNESELTRLFASLGLFGLVASFHGTIIGYSRQIFALARAGYLPRVLAAVNARFQTPHWALVSGGLIGCVALLMGRTDQIIVVAALGAVVMYIISLLALFALRKNDPGMHRPFRVPCYPWFPFIALVLSFVCLTAIVYFNPVLSLWFFGGLTIVCGIFAVIRKDEAQKSEFPSP